MTFPALIVSRLRGATDALRYSVALVEPNRMRLTHVAHIGDVHRVRAEWLAGNFQFEPGRVRGFQ